jgi:hypothetical protein
VPAGQVFEVEQTGQVFEIGQIGQVFEVGQIVAAGQVVAVGHKSFLLPNGTKLITPRAIKRSTNKIITIIFASTI